MVFYSEQALADTGMSSSQMETRIEDDIESTNAALDNSNVDLRLILVHTQMLPYSQDS
ncbi:unnamed protein product, partial [Pylaiella littoralis]